MSNINRKFNDEVRQTARNSVRVPDAVPVISERSGERESAELSEKSLSEARKSMPASVRASIDARAAHRKAIELYYETGAPQRVELDKLTPEQRKAWDLVQRAQYAVQEAEIEVFKEARYNKRVKV